MPRPPSLSLRARLVAAIVLALALSFATGAGLAMWQAARAVRTELSAALDSARAGASAALAAAEESDGRLEPAELARIVAAFDGNRHIRAELRGEVAAVSRLAVAGHTPGWFLAAVSPALPPAILVAAGGSLILAADPANEAFERWSAMREELALLGLFSLLAGALCSVTASRALHPLLALSGGLARLGLGERDVRVAGGGPREISALAASFNALSTALQAARDQNRQLQLQASVLAEEERSEIARELHDEVGPLLFAITAFAAAIARLAAEGNFDAILSHISEIQAATSAIQGEVRDMLGRLHDMSPGAPGLASSLGGLLDFWRRVQPATVFSLDAGDGEPSLGQDAEEALFRVAQEGVSNAVRHGTPGHVTVRVLQEPGTVSLSVEDDGTGGTVRPGHGLTFMRARVAAAGGSLAIMPGQGWIVTATVPAEAAP